jgi:hypothetical protein
MTDNVLATPGGAVDDYTDAVNESLRQAQRVKPDGGIEPAIAAADLGDYLDNLQRIRNASSLQSSNIHFARIETALRAIFYDRLVRKRLVPTTGGKADMQRLLPPSKTLHLTIYGTCSTSSSSPLIAVRRNFFSF